MEIADCTILTDEFRTSFTKKRVTPAQALIYKSMFEDKAGIDPIAKLTVTDEVDRTSVQEYSRLRRIIAKRHVMEVYPGKQPILPTTFADVGLAPKESDEPEPKPAPSDIPVRDDEDEKEYEARKRGEEA